MSQPPPGGPPYGASPPYGTPPPPGGYGGYPPPPPGYGYGYGYGQPGYGPAGYWSPYFGPPGRIRPTGTSILLFCVTLGIYGFIYNYQVHSEMKAHSLRGIGGGVALLLTFLAGIAMPFITPMEVGAMYALRGQRPPVNGWTGLWYAVPAIAAPFFILPFVFLVSLSGSPGVAAGGVLGLYLAYFGVVIAGGVIWFVKTNDALNNYWQSLGVR